MKAMRERMFAKVDADGSGGLSVEEFTEMGKNRPGGAKAAGEGPDAAELFAEIDADGNGEVSQAELEEHAKSRRPSGPPPGPPPGGLLNAETSSSLATLLNEKVDDEGTTLADLLEAADDEAEDGDGSALLSAIRDQIEAYLGVSGNGSAGSAVAVEA